MLAPELPLSYGAACARELLRQRGVAHAEEYIRQEASCSEGVEGVLGGIFAPQLARALSALSHESWVGGPLDDIDSVRQIPLRLRVNVPLVAMLGKHWVSVSGYDDDAFDIVDPEPYALGERCATEGMLDVGRFVERRGRRQSPSVRVMATSRAWCHRKAPVSTSKPISRSCP
jgi:hypothetical protein